ncbi:MAG: hypothetical protein MSH38_02535 [Eubacterium sp.]|nr:hypothetical protein [Eubacterium sp.]
MKGRRAKKGAVLATAVVFMTIIIALSVLVVVFASSSTKRAVNAAKRANSSIEMNLIADEFVTSVKDGHESYYKVDSTTSEEENGAGTETIRELPVATIDAHMNEFAQKINENYSCEVSVSASKTYSLKLIETSDEKKTQIMIVSVDVKENEIKEADGVIKIKYTYSVVKWNTTSQTVEEPNVGDVTNEQQVMKLAQKFLQLYISENKDSNTIMFAISRYIQNLSDLDGEKFSDCQYSIVTERNAYGDEICYSVVCEEDGTYDVIFKYNIVLSAEKKEPSFVIYDNKTLKPKYGFVVYDKSNEEQGGIYCVVYLYNEQGVVIDASEITTSMVTTTNHSEAINGGNQ